MKKRAAKKAAKKRPGRPSKLTPAVLQCIVNGLSQGTPLTVICAGKDMPDDNTVRDWMAADSEIAGAIARAREQGFDMIAMEALRIADTPVIGEEITESEDGMQVKKCDMLGHRKLQIETRLKLLAKWDPKRYGERMAQEISGPNGGPVSVAPAVQLTADQEAALSRVIQDAQERVRRIS